MNIFVHALYFEVVSMSLVGRIVVELILKPSTRTSAPNSEWFRLLEHDLLSVYCNDNKIFSITPVSRIVVSM